MTLVTHSGLVHLAGQPCAAVHVNIEREREPGLKACAHEAENGVDPVVVNEQALPDIANKAKLFCLAVARHAPRQTGLDGCQSANRPAGNTVLERDGAGNLLFALFAVAEVADGAPGRLYRGQSGQLDLPAHIGDMLGVILPGDAVGPQIPLHAGIVDQRQVSPEYQPVETGDDSTDLIAVAGGKLVHGVSFLVWCRSG